MGPGFKKISCFLGVFSSFFPRILCNKIRIKMIDIVIELDANGLYIVSDKNALRVSGIFFDSAHIFFSKLLIISLLLSLAVQNFPPFSSR